MRAHKNTSEAAVTSCLQAASASRHTNFCRARDDKHSSRRLRQQRMPGIHYKADFARCSSKVAGPHSQARCLRPPAGQRLGNGALYGKLRSRLLLDGM